MSRGAIVVWSCGEPRFDVLEIPAEGRTFGRDDVAPSDDTIGRGQHVRVDGDAYRFQVTALGRNRVHVNGAPIKGAHTEYGATPLVQIGRTLLALVEDDTRYRDVKLSKRGELTVGGSLASVCAAVDEAALGEECITLDGSYWIGRELASSYVERVGGETLFVDADALSGPLDDLLSGKQYRSVILALHRPLSRAEIPTLELWLETDLRFVTLLKRATTGFDGMLADLRARLLRRYVEIPRFRFDELPTTIRDIVSARFPGKEIDVEAITNILVRARNVDEDEVLAQLIDSVERCKPTGTFSPSDLRWTDTVRLSARHWQLEIRRR